MKKTLTKWLLGFITLFVSVAFASALIPDEEPVMADEQIVKTDFEKLKDGDINIRQALVGKDKTQKIKLKADWLIDLNPVGTYFYNTATERVVSKTGQDVITIELTSIIRRAEGGINVFVKAWNGTDPIGFGQRGTIETQRIIWKDPLPLIPNPTGEFYAEWTVGSTTYSRTLKQAPVTALRIYIGRGVTYFGKNGSNIIAGTTGNTISSCRPDAHTETDSVDGGIGASAASLTANDIQGARDDTTGADFNDSLGTIQEGAIAYTPGYQEQSGSADHYLTRGFILCDTSEIGSDIVSSTTLSIQKYSGTWGMSSDTSFDYMNIATSNPASDTALENADFDNVGNLKLSDSDIDMENMNESIKTNYEFNAAGIAAVDTTGITKLSLKNGWDFENQTWGGGTAVHGPLIYSADNAGTTDDPQLFYEFAAAPAAPTGIVPIPFLID